MRRPLLLLAATALTLSIASAEPFPTEPLEIGHEPQFVFDLHVVDTTWALKLKGEPMRRVLHRPRHAAQSHNTVRRPAESSAHARCAGPAGNFSSMPTRTPAS